MLLTELTKWKFAAVAFNHHHRYRYHHNSTVSVNLSTGSTQHCGTVFVCDPFLDAFVHHLNLLLLLLLTMMTSRCRCLLCPHHHCTASCNSQSSWEPIEDDWMTFDVLLNAVTTELIVLARKTLQGHHITAELAESYMHSLHRPTFYVNSFDGVLWWGNKMGGIFSSCL